MPRITPLVVLIATLATGCAHRALVREGDLHAGQGNWQAALEDWREAQAVRPANKRIAARIDKAIERIEAERRETVRQALAEAERALRAGDYPAVADAVGRALDADPESVLAREIGAEASLALGGLVADLVAEGQWLDAYPLALTARRLDPGDPSTGERLAEVRSRLIRRAVDRADAGAFAEAHRIASALRRWEPAARSAGVLEEVEDRWAAALRGEARRDEAAGRPASAAARYEQALGMSGDPRDAGARDRLVADVAGDHRFAVDWPAAGGWADHVRGQVRAGTSDLRWSGADAVVEVRDAEVDPWCANSVATRTDRHTYQSGVVLVTNPAWEQASVDLAGAERRMDRAGAVLRGARHDAREAEDAWEHLAHEAVPAAAHDVEHAEETVERLRAREAELLAALDDHDHQDDDAGHRGDRDDGHRDDGHRDDGHRDDGHRDDGRRDDGRGDSDGDDDADRDGHGKRAGGDGPDRQPSAEDILRKRLATVRADLAEAEAALATAREDLEALVARRDRAHRALAEARERLREAVRHLEAAEDAAYVAAAHLQALPEYVEEPVWDTLAYGVEEVTRTCTVRVHLTLSTPEGTVARSYEARARTADERHPAWPEAGLPADPLRLPHSDDDLVAAALVHVSADLGGDLSADRADWYRDLWASVPATPSVEAATARYLAARHLAPGGATADARAWYDATWGLASSRYADTVAAVR